VTSDPLTEAAVERAWNTGLVGVQEGVERADIAPILEASGLLDELEKAKADCDSWTEWFAAGGGGKGEQVLRERIEELETWRSVDAPDHFAFDRLKAELQQAREENEQLRERLGEADLRADVLRAKLADAEEDRDESEAVSESYERENE
jgi:hypothetical protein